MKIQTVDKEVVKKRLPSVIGHAALYGIIGLFIGWSLSHHFVNRYGGEYPNISIVRFVVDVVKPVEIFMYLIHNPEQSIAFITVFAYPVYQLFFRKGATKDKKK